MMSMDTGPSPYSVILTSLISCRKMRAAGATFQAADKSNVGIHSCGGSATE